MKNISALLNESLNDSTYVNESLSKDFAVSLAHVLIICAGYNEDVDTAFDECFSKSGSKESASDYKALCKKFDDINNYALFFADAYGVYNTITDDPANSYDKVVEVCKKISKNWNIDINTFLILCELFEVDY